MTPAQTPDYRARRRFFLFVFIVLAVGLFWLTNRQSADGHAPSFNSSAYSLTDPASPWVIVNKRRPLKPKDYVPTITLPNVALKYGPDAESMHVSTLMAPHLAKLFAAAQRAGHPLVLASGYRSYQYQVKVYKSEVNAYGKSQADEESARPGYSEHQTGLAADVAPADGSCALKQCFGRTATGQWLAAHAYQYGFIIRYPAGKQAVTGYEYEPWHLRYLGVKAATAMHQQGSRTLEAFFNLESAPTYN